jgi:hypothetical protein
VLQPACATSEPTDPEFLRESTAKASRQFKAERKLEIESHESTTAEETSSGEIRNPNNELTLTALFAELQRRFFVTEVLGDVQPVVFVADYVPPPSKITVRGLKEAVDVATATTIAAGSMDEISGRDQLNLLLAGGPAAEAIETWLRSGGQTSPGGDFERDLVRDGQVVVVPSGHTHVEALVGRHPLLENFKLEHREVDKRAALAGAQLDEARHLRLMTGVKHFCRSASTTSAAVVNSPRLLREGASIGSALHLRVSFTRAFGLLEAAPRACSCASVVR